MFFVSAIYLLCACQVNEQRLSDSEKKQVFCQQYNWQSIQEIAVQNLTDDLYVAFVMQGISVNYRTSTGAIQIIDDVSNLQIKGVLQKIIEHDCE